MELGIGSDGAVAGISVERQFNGIDKRDHRATCSFTVSSCTVEFKGQPELFSYLSRSLLGIEVYYFTITCLDENTWHGFTVTVKGFSLDQL